MSKTTNSHILTTATKSVGKIPDGYKLVPPDGNYAWIVAFACFIINSVTVTALCSFGVLLDDIQSLYGTTTATAAWIPSIIISSGQCFGPIHTVIVNTLGCRKSTIIGGIIISFGLITSYFVYRIELLCVTYGMIVGVGHGLCIVSSSIVLSQYFRKYYGIALGFLQASFATSRLLTVPITQYLLEKYGCQGVFLILGANMLNICVVASLFQPVKRHLVLVPIAIESKKLLAAESETDNSEVFVKDNGSEQLYKEIPMTLPLNNDVQTKIKVIPVESIAVSRRLNEFDSVSKTCVRDNATTEDTKDEVNCCSSSWCYKKFCNKIDFSLLREPCFYILCGNKIFLTTVMLFGNMFLFPLGIEKNCLPFEAASIVMLKAIADIISALTAPSIATYLNLSVRKFYMSLGLVNGITLAGVVFIDSYSEILVWAMATGFTFGGMLSINGVLTVETLSVQRLSSIIGLSNFILGLFMLPMASSLGWIRDITGSFVNIYLVLLIAEFLMICLWFIEPYLPHETPRK